MKKTLTALSIATLSLPVLADNLNGTVEAYIDDEANAGLYSAIDVYDNTFIDLEFAEDDFSAVGAGYNFSNGTSIYAAYVSQGELDEARAQIGHGFALTDRFSLRGKLQYRHSLNEDKVQEIVGDADNGPQIAPANELTPDIGIKPFPDMGIERNNVVQDGRIYVGSQVMMYNLGADYAFDSLTLSYDYEYYQQLEEFEGADDAQVHTAKLAYTGFDAATPYLKYAVDEEFSNGLATLGVAISF
ncbi:hypothetical protein JCM19233_6008 [Vibrio astriarenae]|nr:hypothetical protein JCM19233_6008 [Vibrio sp. C7]